MKYPKENFHPSLGPIGTARQRPNKLQFRLEKIYALPIRFSYGARWDNSNSIVRCKKCLVRVPRKVAARANGPLLIVIVSNVILVDLESSPLAWTVSLTESFHSACPLFKGPAVSLLTAAGAFLSFSLHLGDRSTFPSDRLDIVRPKHTSSNSITLSPRDRICEDRQDALERP